MKNFAHIGKSLLIQAVGIQENYIEEVVTEIDTVLSGCSDCVHSFEPEDSRSCHCDKCPTKCFIKKKIYRNEKNRNGNKHRLKSNAIKILIYLHFQAPDIRGIVKNVYLKDMAAAIDCDMRTLNKNIELLVEYGYISTTSTTCGTKNFLIDKYEDYFKTAEEGGRGYIVMNKELMEELLSLNNILALRLFIRNLVEIDSLNKSKDDAPINVITKSYEEIRRNLPGYCKKNIILKALNSKCDIFFIKKEEDRVTFSLNEEYIGKRKRKQLTKRYNYQFEKFINSFNESIRKKREGSLRVDDPNYYFVNGFVSPNFITAMPDEIYRIARLAVYYSFNTVKEMLVDVWEKYTYRGEEIRDYASLTTTFVENAYGKMAIS